MSWIDAAQGVIGPGCIGLLAFDPGRLAARLADRREARRRLGKWLQVTVNLPARKDADGELVVDAPPVDGRAAGARAGFGDRRRARGAAVERGNDAACGARALAAHSPRDAKRFLNAYRLARCSDSPRAGDGAHAGGGLRR